MAERKLATIRKIEEVSRIEGADLICAYRVGGWWVVDSLNKYQVGDLAVYLEIDSWVPNTLAPFLTKQQPPKIYQNIAGARLRTIKLRGQVSQGLLLPISILPLDNHCVGEGDDVTLLLGIQKYEPPLSAQLTGIAKGQFPTFIRKTDQERCQNLTKELGDWQDSLITFEVTEKLDGCSMTVYCYQGEVGVCSRNLNLVQVKGNTFWDVALSFNLIDIVKSLGYNVALQGELVGEGIQKNPYKLKGHHFYLYDVFLIDQQRYMLPWERMTLWANVISVGGAKHVPVIKKSENVSAQVDNLLKEAEGKSSLLKDVDREGVVFKSNFVNGISFKVISNSFLVKEKNDS